MVNGLKVLVVDDSAFARMRVKRRLLSESDFAQVESAADGVAALRKIAEFEPDVVTLDVQMPRMDGLSALEEIMGTHPTPVIMLSGLTDRDSSTTLRSLELGAVDFFLKPDAESIREGDAFAGLVQMVRQASSVPLDKLASADEALMRMAVENEMNRATRSPKKAPSGKSTLKNVCVIASSTGGPKALSQLFPQLPVLDDTGYLVVQHMPAGFTNSLANRLNGASDLEVREAKDRDELKPGIALMAPGGFHMELKTGNRIRLTQNPTIHGVRPAADLTLKSVAKLYGSSTVAAVLTGMGVDGRDGIRAIKQAGGSTCSEHESTCAVYGMPKAVEEAGLSDVVVPIDKIASVIHELLEAKSAKAIVV